MEKELREIFEETWKVLDDHGQTIASLSDSAGYPRWLEEECARIGALRDRIEKFLESYGEPCKCIADANEVLGLQNTRLALPFLGPERMIVATEIKRTGPKQRAKAASMIARYCPICGKEYPQAKNPVSGKIYPGSVKGEIVP